MTILTPKDSSPSTAFASLPRQSFTKMAALEGTFTLFSSYPSFPSSRYAYPLLQKASSSKKFQLCPYTPACSLIIPVLSSVKHSRKSRFELFTAVQEEIEVEDKAENVQLYQKRKLFVYNLPWSLNVADIKNLFGECGTVIDIEVLLYSYIFVFLVNLVCKWVLYLCIL